MNVLAPALACWLCATAPTTGAPARLGLPPRHGETGGAGPRREDTRAAIEQALHAGRFADAFAAIRRLQDGPEVEAPDGTPSLTDLMALAALLLDSWTPAELLLGGRAASDQLTARDASGVWYVRGVLAARAAWPGGRSEQIADARDAAERLRAVAAAEGRLSRSEVRRVLVLAAISGAQEEREEMTLLLDHARHLEEQLEGTGGGDDPLLPLDELAGDLWLQVHRFEDAKRCYRAVVDRHPERTRAWVGLARAAHEAGAAAEAEDAARRVLAAWAGAPGLVQLKQDMQDLVPR